MDELTDALLTARVKAGSASTERELIDAVSFAADALNEAWFGDASEIEHWDVSELTIDQKEEIAKLYYIVATFEMG